MGFLSNFRIWDLSPMGFCNLLKNVCIETTTKVLFLHDHLCKEKPIFAKKKFPIRDFSCGISILFQNQKAKIPSLWDFFSKQKKNLFKYS